MHRTAVPLAASVKREENSRAHEPEPTSLAFLYMFRKSIEEQLPVVFRNMGVKEENLQLKVRENVMLQESLDMKIESTRIKVESKEQTNQRSKLRGPEDNRNVQESRLRMISTLLESAKDLPNRQFAVRLRYQN